MFISIIILTIAIKNIKKFFFVLHIKMLNLSDYELRLVAKIRGIKGYKSMSQDDLTEILSEPKTSLSEERIKTSKKSLISYGIDF